MKKYGVHILGRLRLKCDGACAETRLLLSAKRTIHLNRRGGPSVQSTTGSRGVLISGSNTGYTMFRGSGKSTGYTLHSPVSHSLPLPCVTVCHHLSTGLYLTAVEFPGSYNWDSICTEKHLHLKVPEIPSERKFHLTCAWIGLVPSCLAGPQCSLNRDLNIDRADNVGRCSTDSPKITVTYAQQCFFI